MQLESHRVPLVRLAYRITGDHAEAEDIVQDAFLRAMSGRVDTGRPLRPWLRTVVANLARDTLRRRRRRPYVGPWLPTPMASPDPDPEARLARAEAVGWAALVALERLTPQQRTVLVLRDVAGLTAAEVADTLDTSREAVRAAHTRARRALARAPSEPDVGHELHRRRLAELMMALASGDVAWLRAVFADDVVARNDGGGEVHAATRVVRGADRVARLLVGLSRKNPGTRPAPGWVNDRPALLLYLDDAPPGKAPLTVLLLVLAPDGRVAEVHMVSAPNKLRHLRR